MNERERDSVLLRLLDGLARVDERLNVHLRYHSHKPHWIAAGAAVASAILAAAAILLAK